MKALVDWLVVGIDRLVVLGIGLLDPERLDFICNCLGFLGLGISSVPDNEGLDAHPAAHEQEREHQCNLPLLESPEQVIVDLCNRLDATSLALAGVDIRDKGALVGQRSFLVVLTKENLSFLVQNIKIAVVGVERFLVFNTTFRVILTCLQGFEA